MQTIHSTPVLEALGSAAIDGVRQLKFWQGHIVTDGFGGYYTQASYWSETKDGGMSKVQYSEAAHAEPKNKGKVNETTSLAQAESELKSLVRQQRNRGYHQHGEVVDMHILPMLAQKFADKSHTVTYPCSVQYKLDGVRALCNGNAFWSRKAIEFPSECVAHLLNVQDDCAITAGHALDTKGYTLDGEMILPSPFKLTHTVSALKKFDPLVTPKLLYRVYDLIDEDLTFPARYEILKDIVENAKIPNIILVPTFTANCEEDIMSLHAEFRKEWEGTMIRVHDRGYAVGQRDRQLLKLKDFIEEEFRVVDVVDGDKAKGLAILVLITEEGKTFRAVPEGSQEQRRYLFEHPGEVIGRVWTVRYQERTPPNKHNPSEGNVPKFNTAVCERIASLQGDVTLG